MDNDNRIKEHDNSLDSWYEITYIRHWENYDYVPKDLSYICTSKKLKLVNINGYGKGTLFFRTEENKLMVLNWASIIAMIPINE